MQFLVKVTLINANIAAAELPAAVMLVNAIAAAERPATDTAFLHCSAADCFWFLIYCSLQPIWSIQLGKPGPTAPIPIPVIETWYLDQSIVILMLRRKFDYTSNNADL